MAKCNNNKRNTTAKKAATNGRRSSNNSRARLEREKDYYNDKQNSNDPSWYAADAQLLKDAASIPFSWASGTPVDLGYATDDQADKVRAIPGICAMRLAPSVGFAQTPNDPINIAANAIYTWDRQANSGAANYDAPDLMMYLLSMSSVYSYINYLQRIYGIMRTYSQRNLYTPDALLKAMGVDANDVRNNLANFRFGINLLISKVASMVVPNTMTIFLRHAFLYQNVYIGGPTPKDQFYMFTPMAFFKFKEMEGGGSLAAGTLEYEYMPGPETAEPWGVDKLLKLGNDLIDVIWRSDSARIMSGDLRKAYGDNIIKLESLPVDYTLAFIYDETVLEQFKNATCVGDLNTDGVKQSQDKGYLMFAPAAQVKHTYELTNYGFSNIDDITNLVIKDYGCNHIITTKQDESSPEMVMENTRLVVTVDPNSPEAPFIMSGSEIPVDFWIGVMLKSGNIQWFDFDANMDVLTADKDIGPNYGVAVGDLDEFMEKCSFLSHFKYHPLMRARIWKTVDQGGKTVGKVDKTIRVQDVDNYGIIRHDDIKKLHTAALMNEFAVPSFGKLR